MNGQLIFAPASRKRPCHRPARQAQQLPALLQCIAVLLCVLQFYGQGMNSTGRGGTTTNYFYTYDHLGSVREVVGSDGATVNACYSYDPYGIQSALSGSSYKCEVGYTGHYYHVTSGLYLSPTRAYDPNLGRWISRDPSGEGSGLNLYAYCGDSPINLTDPTGLCPANGGLGWNVFTNAANAVGQAAFSAYWKILLAAAIADGIPASVAAAEVAETEAYYDAAASGGGEWQAVNESMSDRAAAYQAQVTGQTGQAYVVNGVKFDGVDAQGLIEAKGPGYAQFVNNGQFQPFFSGADDLVAQAQRQLTAANGTPITWQVAEPEAATAIQNLFQSRGIQGITVVHTPVAP